MPRSDTDTPDVEDVKLPDTAAVAPATSMVVEPLTAAVPPLKYAASMARTSESPASVRSPTPVRSKCPEESNQPVTLTAGSLEVLER